MYHLLDGIQGNFFWVMDLVNKSDLQMELIPIGNIQSVGNN